MTRGPDAYDPTGPDTRIGPIELETRRATLGLSQTDLGRCLALVGPHPDGTPRRPVSQNTISRWEKHGIPTPELAAAIRSQLDLIGDFKERLSDRIRTVLEHSSAVRDSPHTTVRLYRTDQAFWDDWPRLAGWPRGVWNTAALLAAGELDDEHGTVTRFEEH